MTPSQANQTDTHSQGKPKIEIVDNIDPKVTPMEFDQDNAKEEVVEYSDLDDH